MLRRDHLREPGVASFDCVARATTSAYDGDRLILSNIAQVLKGFFDRSAGAKVVEKVKSGVNRSEVDRSQVLLFDLNLGGLDFQVRVRGKTSVELSHSFSDHFVSDEIY